MCISSLHPSQQKILGAIQDAVRTLKMADHLAIVGGIAKHLAGDAKLPGDIDVLIERPLCERYWEFLEMLVRDGIRSVRNVLNPPTFFRWKPCLQEIAHALALTIDCADDETVRRERHADLDICLAAADLDHIPRSGLWVVRFDPAVGVAQAIRDGHQRLVAQLRQKEKRLAAPVLSQELGLYYRLECPERVGG
jgi:hypothetical protein